MKDNLIKLKKFIDEHRNYVIIASIIVALVILIVIVLMINNTSTNRPIPDTDINQLKKPAIPSDVSKLESIITKVDNSELELISNREDDQADIILDTIGISLDDIYSYAAVIDPRIEGIHSIIIMKPKDDCYSTIKTKLLCYLDSKIVNFSRLGQEDNQLIAENSGLREINGYIVLVLDSSSESILDEIEQQLLLQFKQ